MVSFRISLVTVIDTYVIGELDVITYLPFKTILCIHTLLYFIQNQFISTMVNPFNCAQYSIILS